jgi:uncharacterized protein (DUF305 family)
MLTAAQPQELAPARAPEYDRLSPPYLTHHHPGADTLEQELYGTPGAAQEQTVFKFANDVNVDQTTEIARMERMLAALPAGEPST